MQLNEPLGEQAIPSKRMDSSSLHAKQKEWHVLYHIKNQKFVWYVHGTLVHLDSSAMYV